MMDRDYYDYGNPSIRSTAGAVPIVNDKGEVTMQKVKVTRYVSGKRPLYAPDDEESSDEEAPQQIGDQDEPEDADNEITTPAIDIDEAKLVQDKRLQRLLTNRVAAVGEDADEDFGEDHVRDDDDNTEHVTAAPSRRIREAEVIEYEGVPAVMPILSDSESGEEDDADEFDEEEMEQRRQMMRNRVIQKQNEDLLAIEEEAEERLSGNEEDEVSSEDEEYTDSEEDDMGPRLKPMFIRKEDRVTIQERQQQEATQEQLEQLNKLKAEQRKKDSIRLVAEVVAKELESAKVSEADQSGEQNTDDENEEEEYEAWKVRELKRIKRTREERETMDREKMEIERMRNLTEEERKAEQRNNPRIVTNEQVKGKYKFLQKYYHRGAFYLDEDDSVYKRDFAQPTLEDHFNKTVLPKVMQVKNFGRSGRTKYTHLVDQDTTGRDSAWAQPTAAAINFHNKFGGGMKQTFEKPTAKKRKTE